MAKNKKLKKYILILEKVQQSKFPSRIEIEDYLEEWGCPVGTRTLQRLLEELRSEFFIDIKYSQDEKGYFIEEENSEWIEQFSHLLTIAETSNLILNSIEHCHETLEYIDFDLKKDRQGQEFFAPLLKAIKSHRLIQFYYKGFEKKAKLHQEFQAYLLKEYLNRWYIVGLFTNSPKTFIFALDRIQGLEVSEQTFVVDKNFKPKQFFAERIGITLGGETEEIVLSFLPSEKMYIKTLPLHPSQKELIDNENEYRISIKVVINYELIVEILKHGRNVKVLAPSNLAERIQQNLSDTLSYYKL